MPRILNFGSLNIDYTYNVPAFVQAGETIAASDMKIFCGGKGLNQSIALSRAGAVVYHAGAVGKDGDMLISVLEKSCVDTSLVKRREGVSGHAIIQIDPNGRNCILVYGGANQSIAADDIDNAINNFGPGDYLILQNEINLVDEIMKKARTRGIKIVFNPSPLSDSISAYPLELVDILVLNEVEAMQIIGERNTTCIISSICEKFPQSAVVLTLGENGVMYKDSLLAAPLEHKAFKIKVVDTTAAGDTFTGYFIGGIAKGLTVIEALETASAASALSVSRQGAEPSIPYLDEVGMFILSYHKNAKGDMQ